MEEAVGIAESIRKTIEELSLEEGIKITISSGLYENREDTKYTCIQKVDELLYLAKEKGRNRTEMYVKEEIVYKM
ncbi:MAG: diguanylate cyclase [Clostridium sp.]|nr:diguanylate cyclase [Clostridium sp.]